MFLESLDGYPARGPGPFRSRRDRTPGDIERESVHSNMLFANLGRVVITRGGNVRTGVEFDVEFLLNFSSCGVVRRLTGFNFATGKLPQVCTRSVGCPKRCKHLEVAGWISLKDDCHRDLDRLAWGWGWCLIRIISLQDASSFQKVT